MIIILNNNIGFSSDKIKFKNISSNISDDEESHREGRSKRGVLHLYSMIKCATGCDPLQYKGCVTSIFATKLITFVSHSQLRLLLWFSGVWKSTRWHRSLLQSAWLLLRQCKLLLLYWWVIFAATNYKFYCFWFKNLWNFTNIILHFVEYLVPYLWKCYRGKPLCAIGKLNEI